MDATSNFEPDLDSERVWSVAEINGRIKRLLEGEIGNCWVRGEVSNLRRQASGHNYFSLKDQSGQIRAVLFRGDAARQQTLPEDGAQVVVFGQISVYEPQGTYQIIVRHVMLIGTGQLQMEFERLKHKLSDEGLFNEERKRAIPEMPRRIAFVTSPTGAAVKDFISVLRRRGWRGEVFVVPAKVQGDEAPAELLEGLRIASELEGLDLVVIGRGGGSVEDLWAFNDETLVREIANFPIPLISAVGHQIDFVLTDFVADQRAETPTAAAEILSHGFFKANERWQRCSDGLETGVRRVLEDCRAEMRWMFDKLRAASPVAKVENLSLRVDDLGNRLAICLRDASSLARKQLSALENRFAMADPGNRFRLERAKMDGLEKRLQSGSLESTLRRGFALVSDSEGHPISRREALTAGQDARIRFMDGEVATRILE